MIGTKMEQEETAKGKTICPLIATTVVFYIPFFYIHWREQ